MSNLREREEHVGTNEELLAVLRERVREAEHELAERIETLQQAEARHENK